MDCGQLRHLLATVGGSRHLLATIIGKQNHIWGFEVKGSNPSTQKCLKIRREWMEIKVLYLGMFKKANMI